MCVCSWPHPRASTSAGGGPSPRRGERPAFSTPRSPLIFRYIQSHTALRPFPFPERHVLLELRVIETWTSGIVKLPTPFVNVNGLSGKTVVSSWAWAIPSGKPAELAEAFPMT